MSDMKLKVKFVDFWDGFDEHYNTFVNVLSEKYEIEICDHPDYLIYSTFGYKNLKYENCVKIFYTGENITPDFNLCDYAIGFDIMEFGDRYMRLPLYALYGIEELRKPKVFNSQEALNRKFCSFVVSNGADAPERTRFFHLLSEYKQVDSGGAYENNVGGRVVDKKFFISNYKFNIAFENSAKDGYTTEKIMEPMLVNSLPIYWGNRLVELDFNPNSFINAADYPSLEALVEYIVELDTNDDKYLSILSRPWLNKSNYLDWQERLFSFFENVFNKPLNEQKYLSPYGYGKLYRRRLMEMYIAKRKLKKWKMVCNPCRWFR
ncbi:glycosyltransferase family 10 domain-containing protein [Bacteroides reticulotermitis]|nr:glycosyltransferase family 10 [Bacteroides reticulotermitis]